MNSIHVLFTKVIYIKVGLPHFRERQAENQGQKGEISHFFRAFKGSTTKKSLNDGETLNYLFLV